MTEMAILFDSSRCTGCRGCQVACKCWNDLPSEPTAENPYDSVNWDGKFTHPADLNSCTRLIMTFEDFEDEKSQKRVGWAFGRRACQHCTNAGCVTCVPQVRCIRTGRPVWSPTTRTSALVARTVRQLARTMFLATRTVAARPLSTNARAVSIVLLRA